MRKRFRTALLLVTLLCNHSKACHKAIAWLSWSLEKKQTKCCHMENWFVMSFIIQLQEICREKWEERQSFCNSWVATDDWVLSLAGVGRGVFLVWKEPLRFLKQDVWDLYHKLISTSPDITFAPWPILLLYRAIFSLDGLYTSQIHEGGGKHTTK